MHVSGCVFRLDLAVIPVHDASGIHAFVDHECRNTGRFLAIDHCPVDRGGATILRQKGRVEVECSEFRDLPYHLRQHSECDHNEKIRLPCLDGIKEFRILE